MTNSDKPDLSWNDLAPEEKARIDMACRQVCGHGKYELDAMLGAHGATGDDSRPLWRSAALRRGVMNAA